MPAQDYGQYYWCVKVTKDIAKAGEIYLHADDVLTTQDGAVRFVQKKDDGQAVVMLLIPSGKWRAVYAASVLDGSAVAVVHWAEEITE
jgi:hypothetical protein